MSASWVRIDASYFRHPKVRTMGKDGRSLDVAGICWCALNETDGHVPKHALSFIAGEAEVKPTVVKLLVAAGRWDVVDDGWMIHDYLDYNRSAEETRAQRNKWQKQKAAQRGKSTADNDADSDEDSSSQRNGTGRSPLALVDNSHPSTTRPDDFRAKVADRYAEIAWERANQSKINEPGIFRDSRRTTALKDPKLDVYRTRYPEATAGEIAAWLHGEKHSMRYHEAAQ